MIDTTIKNLTREQASLLVVQSVLQKSFEHCPDDIDYFDQLRTALLVIEKELAVLIEVIETELERAHNEHAKVQSARHELRLDFWKKLLEIDQ